MDRQLIYPGAIPLETDLLNTNKNAMIGLAKLAAAVLGASTMLNGLACTPTGPASLQVYVAPGEIYSLQNMDGTAYSSIAADTTHAILKQGVMLDQATLTCAAPGTAGQSINYLIQVTYQDTDSGATVLPYYNASNPSQAYSGPANSGTAQNTVRKGVCTVSAKTGVAATTGSQTTPAPDAGYVGMFVVTVANGQTQITAPNISTYPSAPFLPSAGLIVGGLQGNACNISAAGGTADAITGIYVPGITALTNGMTLYVRAGSANATTTPTFTPASGTIAAKTIVKGAGAALAAGDIAGGGHWIELQYDLTLDKWVLLNPATGVSVATSATISGNFRNLIIYNDGVTPNNKLNVFADEVVLKDASGNSKLVSSVSVSPDITTIGANGLDTGAEAANTWYSVWIINNGTTTAGLLSASASAPTMPSGYTFKARVGWVRNDGSSNFLKFKQVNRRAQYTVPQVMASGVAGNVSTPTWVAVAVGAFVPSTAGIVYIGLQRNGSSGQVMVAANNGFGAINSNGAPQPPINDNDTSAGTSRQFQGTLVLESTNLYWASAGASNYLMCQGWDDV